MDPVLIEQWLAARDHASIRRAWAALPTRIHPTPEDPRRNFSLHGAALLAGAMLGERADWIVDSTQQGPPVYETRGVADGSFLDHCWNVNDACDESLRIHARLDGLRGVQLISIGAGSITGRPEGGGVTVVRVVDRDRAAIVPIDSWGSTLATIGEIDLAPLDLYMYTGPFQLASASDDIATARGVVAQLAAEVDAHYDTSTLWSEGEASFEERPHWYDPDISARQTFVDGARGVTFATERSGRIWTHVHGLPWGQRLGFSLAGTSLYLSMRFPNADLDRILARLGALGR